jgi:hypothetical protein
MTKLCPRGKAAAKRKFRVYPSAYANAYASKICAGKIKDPSGVKRKDFKGRKPAFIGGLMEKKDDPKAKEAAQKRKLDERIKKQKQDKKEALDKLKKELNMKAGGRAMRAGGGLMEATARLKRQGLRGGGICTKGMNRQAVGKNS